MAATNEDDHVVVTFQNLVAESNAEIVSASLRDLRKILHDGPEPFSLKAEGPRNEVLAAVLDLKTSLLSKDQPQNEDQENFAKLFDMSTEELVGISGCARPNLVRLMQSALRCADTLSPRTFDASEQSGILSVVLKWKLDSTNQALQDSLNMNPTSNERTRPSVSPNAPAPSPTADALEEEQPQESQPSRATANPFAEADQPATTGEDLLSLLQRCPPKKRVSNMLTVQDVNGGKWVRFTTLGHMSHGNHENLGESANQGFQRGGSPSDQLPPHLIGEYVGRYSTKLVIRVFNFKGGQILAGLLQEGTTIESVIRNRHWKRSASGEPYQAEQEAATLARVIHLTLMSFATVDDALSMASWLETCLRRLFAILYVEEHVQSTTI